MEKEKNEEEYLKIGESVSDIILDLNPVEKPKKLTLLEVLGKLSPGKSLRIALDDILQGKTGALIAVDCPGFKGIMEGGFRINCRFTPQKLAELAKMDGAIILSNDLKKILFANVLLVPDKTIATNETGIRHKSAERTAKQTGTIVIAVSAKRNKITLFYDGKKYILENSDSLLRKATETLNILEKQREIFDDLLKNFNILEITKLVSVADVCSLLQRAEVINKMLETIKRDLVELGNQGIILRMRVKELSRDLEEIKTGIIKDYSSKPQNTKKILSGTAFERMIDINALSRMLFELSPDSQVSPKGYRLLSKLNLTDKEIKNLIINFGNLSNIIDSNAEELRKILKAKAESFKAEFDNLKEQILVGKKI